LNIRSHLNEIQSSIANKSDTPTLDAQTLLAHILGRSRVWLLTHPEATLSTFQLEKLTQAKKLLQAGSPLPYILGHWEFYGLDFDITPDTLIPRPETELLIEQAITWLKNHPSCRNAVDIGTGSGCIAVSLAVHISDLHVTATDISLPALEIAQGNASKHLVADRIEFIQADLLPPSLRPVEAIFANLPYVPTQTLKNLDVYGREPTLALDGGNDGLSLIHRLLPAAAQNLTSGGLLLLEIEATQGKTAIQLARKYFPDAQTSLRKDFAGQDRLISIQI